MADDLSSDELEDRLCLALYRASHAMAAAYRKVLDPLGLTYPQYTVLCALWRSRSATVKSLGELLGTDHGTMSPLVQRLEAKALVRRTRDDTDERQVLVHLTDGGRQLQSRVGDVQARIGRANGLSDRESAGLVDDLKHLTDHLREFVSTASATSDTSFGPGSA